MSFADASGAVSVKVDRQLADQIRAAGAKLLPRVANIDANGEWFESGLGDFLRSAAAADAFRADFTYATGVMKAPALACANAGRLRYLDLGFFGVERVVPNALDYVLTGEILSPLSAFRSPLSTQRVSPQARGATTDTRS